MLDAGIPLAETLSIMADAAPGRTRRMLSTLREAVRNGSSLHEAMAMQAAWFDATEQAMADSGQRSGELGSVLRSLSSRHQRSEQLTQRLVAVLTYPAAVLVVGAGVVVFLSTNTLPNLAQILENAGTSVPLLTSMVMVGGQFLAAFWLWLVLGSIVLVIMIRWLISRLGVPAILDGHWPPRTLREALLARALLTIAELVRTGVTVVEAMRVTAPTLGGPGSLRLRAALRDAADAIEYGESVADALPADRWFDAETRQLIAVGESAGELPRALDRLGERMHRRASRTIDRLTSLLEPIVILALAMMVAVVVLAAILPLIKLQEVV